MTSNSGPFPLLYGAGSPWLFHLRENQQQEAVTPDVRFRQPTIVCGHLCLWLEYKNYFGFRSNQFVAAKDKKQFRKYATQIGPVAVVYKLGFETSHVNIDGVKTFREKEVLEDIRIKSSKTIPPTLAIVHH